MKIKLIAESLTVIYSMYACANSRLNSRTFPISVELPIGAKLIRSDLSKTFLLPQLIVSHYLQSPVGSWMDLV